MQNYSKYQQWFIPNMGVCCVKLKKPFQIIFLSLVQKIMSYSSTKLRVYPWNFHTLHTYKWYKQYQVYYIIATVLRKNYIFVIIVIVIYMNVYSVELFVINKVHSVQQYQDSFYLLRLKHSVQLGTTFMEFSMRG